MLNLSYYLMMVYICTTFQENILQLLRGTVCILKFSKGHYSINSVNGVTIFILSTSSDNLLYLYQVLSKYLIGFQSYRLER